MHAHGPGAWILVVLRAQVPLGSIIGFALSARVVLRRLELGDCLARTRRFLERYPRQSIDRPEGLSPIAQRDELFLCDQVLSFAVSHEASKLVTLNLHHVRIEVSCCVTISVRAHLSIGGVRAWTLAADLALLNLIGICLYPYTCSHVRFYSV